MKKLLAGLLCAAMLLSMAACGGTSESSAPSESNNENSSAQGSESQSETESSVANVELPDEEVDLKLFLQSYNPTVNTEPTEESPSVFLSSQIIADEYLRLHPNVTIEWVRSLVASNAEEHLEKMNILANAGNAPDVFFAWGNVFANQGWLAEFNDVLKPPTNMKRATRDGRISSRSTCGKRTR